MPLKFTWPLVVATTVLSGLALAQNENPNTTAKGRILVQTRTGRYGVGAEKVDPRDLGVAIYPGSKLAKNEDDKRVDDGAALFLDWGKDHTHLYVQKYISSDPTEKIVSFYRKQLSKYGAVMECRGGKAVNAGAKGECDNGGDDNDIELRVGQDGRQHIVAVTPRANGTEFAIVYLEKSK